MRPGTILLHMPYGGQEDHVFRIKYLDANMLYFIGDVGIIYTSDTNLRRTTMKVLDGGFDDEIITGKEAIEIAEHILTCNMVSNHYVEYLKRQIKRWKRIKIELLQRIHQAHGEYNPIDIVVSDDCSLLMLLSDDDTVRVYKLTNGNLPTITHAYSLGILSQVDGDGVTSMTGNSDLSTVYITTENTGIHTIDIDHSDMSYTHRHVIDLNLEGMSVGGVKVSDDLLLGGIQISNDGLSLYLLNINTDSGLLAKFNLSEAYVLRSMRTTYLKEVDVQITPLTTIALLGDKVMKLNEDREFTVLTVDGDDDYSVAVDISKPYSIIGTSCTKDGMLYCLDACGAITKHKVTQ